MLMVNVEVSPTPMVDGEKLTLATGTAVAVPANSSKPHAQAAITRFDFRKITAAYR
jgi:hypothetical protein